LYKEDGNKDFKHIKEGLLFLHSVMLPYKYQVTLLADRGFKSVDLFKFIDEDLNWKYCIRDVQKKEVVSVFLLRISL